MLTRGTTSTSTVHKLFRKRRWIFQVHCFFLLQLESPHNQGVFCNSQLQRLKPTLFLRRSTLMEQKWPKQSKCSVVSVGPIIILSWQINDECNSYPEMAAIKQKTALSLAAGINSWIEELKLDTSKLVTLVSTRSTTCSQSSAEIPIVTFDEYKLRCAIQVCVVI